MSLLRTLNAPTLFLCGVEQLLNFICHATNLLVYFYSVTCILHHNTYMLIAHRYKNKF